VSLILKPASEAAPFQTGGGLALDAIRVLRDVCFGITSERLGHRPSFIASD